MRVISFFTLLPLVAARVGRPSAQNLPAVRGTRTVVHGAPEDAAALLELESWSANPDAGDAAVEAVHSAPQNELTSPSQLARATAESEASAWPVTDYESPVQSTSPLGPERHGEHGTESDTHPLHAAAGLSDDGRLGVPKMAPDGSTGRLMDLQLPEQQREGGVATATSPTKDDDDVTLTTPTSPITDDMDVSSDSTTGVSSPDSRTEEPVADAKTPYHHEA